MKTALQDWLNPEDTTTDTPTTTTTEGDTGYTLNVKQKESFNEDEFDDLFKD
jgi:hypothetical protein